MKSRMVDACDVVAGNIMFLNGEWWLVKNNYCHPQSCYAKMNLTNEEFAKEYGKNASYATCKAIGKNSRVEILTEEAVEEVQANLTHVKISDALHYLRQLEQQLRDYSIALQLPSEVKLENCNFAIKSSIIAEDAHQAVVATSKQLANIISSIKK